VNVEELKVLATTERDALQARITELEAAIGALSVYVPRAVWGESVLPCLARTPAQSVAHIEVATLRRVAKALPEVSTNCLDVCDGHVMGATDCAEWLNLEADDIEQAAKS
jgi:hypothetical protein